jgi:hypothetical protein
MVRVLVVLVALFDDVEGVAVRVRLVVEVNVAVSVVDVRVLVVVAVREVVSDLVVVAEKDVEDVCVWVRPDP